LGGGRVFFHQLLLLSHNMSISVCVTIRGRSCKKGR
jgi:hypothetical protein